MGGRVIPQSESLADTPSLPESSKPAAWLQSGRQPALSIRAQKAFLKRVRAGHILRVWAQGLKHSLKSLFPQFSLFFVNIQTRLQAYIFLHPLPGKQHFMRFYIIVFLWACKSIKLLSIVRSLPINIFLTQRRESWFNVPSSFDDSQIDSPPAKPNNAIGQDIKMKENMKMTALFLMVEGWKDCYGGIASSFTRSHDSCRIACSNHQ